MAWEDTELDSKAELEALNPEELVGALRGYFEGTRDSYYSDWKNHFLGIQHYNDAINCGIEEYVEAVQVLKDDAAAAAKNLLARTSNEYELEDWFCSAEINRMQKVAAGETYEGRTFMPNSHCTWFVKGVTTSYSNEAQGFVNEEAVTATITLEDARTGQHKKHVVTYTVDLDALFNDDDFRAPLRYVNQEKLVSHTVHDSMIEAKFSGKPENYLMSTTILIPATFIMKGDEGNYERPLSLRINAWFVPTTGELQNATTSAHQVR